MVSSNYSYAPALACVTGPGPVQFSLSRTPDFLWACEVRGARVGADTVRGDETGDGAGIGTYLGTEFGLGLVWIDARLHSAVGEQSCVC